MKHTNYIRIVLLAFVTTGVLLLTACQKQAELPAPASQTQDIAKQPEDLPAAYQIQQSEKLTIPAAVELPANPNGNSRVATYYATGIQRYEARVIPGTDPVMYQWVFVGPLAVLFDVTNKVVGIHGAGPVWQLYGDVDKITGQHFTPARTAPSPDPSSIDWLLLMPKVGTQPTGIFEDVDYIQRIATTGGKAPVLPPTSATDAVNVDYTAVYRFSKSN
jgi:hypothetical protein